MDYKFVFAVFASILAFVSYIPYFRNILANKTKPHAFSWLIWSIISAIIFLVQLSEGAGVGALGIGITSLVVFLVFVLALVKGDRKFSKNEWVLLLAAFSSIGLWVAFKDPLYSVILLTIADAFAFAFTFKKGFHKPNEETVLTFALNGIKFVFILLSLEAYTMATVIFPIYLIVANFLFVSMILIRRSKSQIFL